MGINKYDASLIYKNPHLFKDKKILSLGNPFGSLSAFCHYLDRYERKSLSDIPRNSQAKFLFEKILKARCFHVLDISPDEGADYIADLNDSIQASELTNAYDAVLDLGTGEHVFNSENFLKNAVGFLREGGFYIFDLPANCQLEHGFRQYSPTYFYDLCASNQSALKICHLSIRMRGILLNTLPMYQKIDNNFADAESQVDIKKPGILISTGKLTNICVLLANKVHEPIGLIGVIKIASKDKDGLNLNAVQCSYRNFSLAEVNPDSNLSRNSSLKKTITSTIKSLCRQLLLNMPPMTTIKVLSFINNKSASQR